MVSKKGAKAALKKVGLGGAWQSFKTTNILAAKPLDAFLGTGGGWPEVQKRMLGWDGGKWDFGYMKPFVLGGGVHVLDGMVSKKLQINRGISQGSLCNLAPEFINTMAELAPALAGTVTFTGANNCLVESWTGWNPGANSWDFSDRAKRYFMMRYGFGVGKVLVNKLAPSINRKIRKATGGKLGL